MVLSGGTTEKIPSGTSGIDPGTFRLVAQFISVICDIRILIVVCLKSSNHLYTRVGTLIVATIYLQLIQNRYMFRSFTVLQCSYQHCVQPVASDVEVVGYL